MDVSLFSVTLMLLVSARGDDPTVPHGRYVEARTASVFAGACHYGSESTTQGREALLAWHFEGGRHADVDLAGVDVACALASERNLAEASGVRRVLIYVSNAASESQAEAALALLRERQPALFAPAQAARRTQLNVMFRGDEYTVTAPGAFLLHGATLPDRACCRMPHDVWYRPLATIEGALVGHNGEFTFSDKALGGTWSRADENTSFTGAFRFAPREELTR